MKYQSEDKDENRYGITELKSQESEYDDISIGNELLGIEKAETQKQNDRRRKRAKK